MQAILVVVICIGFVSCKDDKGIKRESLRGKWLLENATRNGQHTETLHDAFFHFVNDTLLINNLLREEKDFRYRLDGAKIYQHGEIDVVYSIDLATDQELHLSAEIMNYHFQFFLNKDTADLPMQ